MVPAPTPIPAAAPVEMVPPLSEFCELSDGDEAVLVEVWMVDVSPVPVVEGIAL